MKQKLFILLLCVSCFKINAQNLFVAAYATGGGSTDLSLITYDRCFFSAFEGPGRKVTVMKTDSAGNVLWSNQIDYQNTGFFYFMAIEQAADSGFFLLLNITQPGMPHSDPTITRLDKTGNYLWTQNYVSVGSAFAAGIIKNNDNGFMVIGSQQGNDFVMKCDANGSITWLKHFIDGTGANHAIATHDYNHFAITGRRGGTNLVFFEIDLLGNLYWNSAISFANNGIGHLSMKPGSDGGYIVAGQISYVAGHNYDPILLRTDSLGAVQWLRVYSVTNETGANDVEELADGSLLLVGYNQGNNSIALKTDAAGNLLFSKTEILPFCYYGSVHSFTPGTVLIGGRRGGVLSSIALADTALTSLCNITPLALQELQPAYLDTVIAFASVNLQFTPGVPPGLWTINPLVRNVLCGSTSTLEIMGQNEIGLYPNPATNGFTVETGDPSSPFVLDVYDAYGRLIFSETNLNSGYRVNTHGWADGLYSVVVNKGNNMTTLKLVKQELE